LSEEYAQRTLEKLSKTIEGRQEQRMGVAQSEGQKLLKWIKTLREKRVDLIATFVCVQEVMSFLDSNR
jgi:hypothetical protein